VYDGGGVAQRHGGITVLLDGIEGGTELRDIRSGSWATTRAKPGLAERIRFACSTVWNRARRCVKLVGGTASLFNCKRDILSIDRRRIGAPTTRLGSTSCAMNQEHTTAVVQRYLDELAGDSPAEPIVRAMLDRAVRRLHLLCATLLFRGYPRLTHPPLNLEVDELLGALAERLLKALREARPRTVRQFFALANQHIRWELNDLARRLDNQPVAVELCEGVAPSPATSSSGLSADGLRMLQAVSDLPEDEREAFDLVRVQGMTHVEAAQVLGVSAATVKRRLYSGLRLLTEQLADLRPGEKPQD
jgi:RNA polymerase sigma-70 factor (ECF subfamily)